MQKQTKGVPRMSWVMITAAFMRLSMTIIFPFVVFVRPFQLPRLPVRSVSSFAPHQSANGARRAPPTLRRGDARWSTNERRPHHCIRYRHGGASFQSPPLRWRFPRAVAAPTTPRGSSSGGGRVSFRHHSHSAVGSGVALDDSARAAEDEAVPAPTLTTANEGAVSPDRGSKAEVGDSDTARWRNNIPSLTIFYNDVYEVHLPKNHRFPMEKYRMVRERVQAQIAAMDIVAEGARKSVNCEFRVSPLATVDELTTTHSPEYVERYMRGVDLTERELRNVGFPWSRAGVDRSLSSVGGTIAAAQEVCSALRRRAARDDRSCDDDPQTQPKGTVWAAHVAGGTHHAFRDRGEGFCVFSDIAVAANVMLERFPDTVRRILIVDLDVHQGNGNARLFEGREEVVTFSMHCESNYFSPKEESDLDIELPAGCTDGTYLQTLRHWLKQLFATDENDGGTAKYDLVFFQAGVDIIEEDRLGRMSLTSSGVQRRNELVYSFVKDSGAGLVITMGGGYPRDDWGPIIEAHADVYLRAHSYLGRCDPT